MTSKTTAARVASLVADRPKTHKASWLSTDIGLTQSRQKLRVKRT